MEPRVNYARFAGAMSEASAARSEGGASAPCLASGRGAIPPPPADD